MIIDMIVIKRFNIFVEISLISFDFLDNLYHAAGPRGTQLRTCCGSPPGVIVADTLSFNAKIGVVDF